ncbi:hypothetical protein BGW80DRAFT_1442408 [Lactifluus volemus]|nr:hypothetical protein BGW80DRAFT_1442408 [Lactifluus volemus]
MDVPTCEAARLFSTISLLDTSVGGGGTPHIEHRLDHLSHGRSHIHRNILRWPIEIVQPSASTSASMTLPAAHTPISPQSVFGGPSPTLALHPSNKPAELDSMFKFNPLAAQASSKFVRLAAVRAVKAPIQSNLNNKQAQVVGSHSLPARPVSVQVPRQSVSSSADWAAVAMSSIGSGSSGGAGVL